MRLAALYLRARRTGHVLVALCAVAVLGWLWTDTMLAVPLLRSNNRVFIPVLCFIPLLAAIVLGAAAYSPFGEVERIASLPLPTLRLAHLAALLAWALAALTVAAVEWQHAWAQALLARNLAGFAGLAFLGATLLGSRVAWLVPLAFGLVAYRLGAIAPGQFTWWAWPLQPVSHGGAAALALGLLAGGLAAVALLGGRDCPGEVD